MTKIAIVPNAAGSGVFTIAAPNSNTNRTLTLPDASGAIEVFPAGTKMLFAQTTAPTGWTKDTTHNDKALRVVTGTAGSGGSVAFTTAFASQAVSGTVGDTTLTTAQIPAHTHVQTVFRANSNPGPIPVGFATVGAEESGSYSTKSTGGGGAHNHSFTGTAINLAVSYVDVIIATKS